jgi:hypothetical protein
LRRRPRHDASQDYVGVLLWVCEGSGYSFGYKQRADTGNLECTETGGLSTITPDVSVNANDEKGA